MEMPESSFLQVSYSSQMNIPSIIIYVPPRTCSRFHNFGSVTERISAGDSTENGKAYLGGVGLLPGPPPPGDGSSCQIPKYHRT
jgi:hypothetical protein